MDQRGPDGEMDRREKLRWTEGTKEAGHGSCDVEAGGVCCHHEAPWEAESPEGCLGTQAEPCPDSTPHASPRRHRVCHRHLQRRPRALNNPNKKQLYMYCRFLLICLGPKRRPRALNSLMNKQSHMCCRFLPKCVSPKGRPRALNNPITKHLDMYCRFLVRCINPERKKHLRTMRRSRSPYKSPRYSFPGDACPRICAKKLCACAQNGMALGIGHISYSAGKQIDVARPHERLDGSPRAQLMQTAS